MPIACPWFPHPNTVDNGYFMGLTFSDLIKRNKMPLASGPVLAQVSPHIPAANTIATGISIRRKGRAVNMENAWWILDIDSNQMGWFSHLTPFSLSHCFQITSVPRLGLELPPVPCAPRALKETESNIFEPHRQLPCPRIWAYVVSFSLHFSPYVFPTPLGRDEKPGWQLHWRGIYITPRRASGREAG